jgi:cytochrome c oxidase assembly protein subunit 15
LETKQVHAIGLLRLPRASRTAARLFYTGWFNLEPSFMPSTAVGVDQGRLASSALRRFAWGVLVYFIAVILWGTLVRATGSGAGCGNHWPLCNGTVMQHSASVNTMIEFTHRLTSGLSFFMVVGLAAWTFAGTGRGHLARAAAVASVAFTLIEATLGALLVKLGLTAQSQSPLRPAYLALHLTNTLLLVAALTLSAHLLSRTKGYLRGSIRLVAPFGALATIVVVMMVGVTGSLAALGDTLFPASSLGLALAQDFSPASGWLVRWRWTHPTVAFVASIFLIWLLVRAARRSAAWDNRGLSALVLLLLAAVYTLGLLDVFLLAPLWVQVAHLLAADTLWATLVVLTARLTLQPLEAE